MSFKSARQAMTCTANSHCNICMDAISKQIIELNQIFQCCQCQLGCRLARGLCIKELFHPKGIPTERKGDCLSCTFSVSQSYLFMKHILKTAFAQSVVQSQMPKKMNIKH